MSPFENFNRVPILLPVKNSRLNRLKTRRKLWLEVHLWLGLILGFFLTVFGITGSILVFQAEIDELLNPRLLTVTVPAINARYKPLADIFQVAATAMPSQAQQSFAYYPRNNEAAIKIFYKVPVNQEEDEKWEVAVNPYTAKVTGKRLMKSPDSVFPKTLIGFVFELHYAFFMGDVVGYTVTSIMAALLIISTLSGLIVWWPLTGKWRQALTLKSKASFTRLNFDLHKTGGFYSAIVLVVVFFSGLFMNMPERVIPLIELFSPTSFRYGFKSTPQPNLTPIGMAEAVAITDRLYPDGRSDWLYSGIKKDGTYSVCKKDIHTAHSFLDRRCVVLDKYTGKTLDIDDPSRDSGGDVFIQWQWGLHSGQAFGWTGRILIFLSGLVCPLLFVTGVIRWWQKRIAANTKRHFA